MHRSLREFLRFFVFGWLVVVCGSAVASEWGFIERHDPMEDIEQYGAKSPMVGVEEGGFQLKFNDLKAALVIACNSEGKQWAYIVFNLNPDFPDSEIATETHSYVPMAVRWDSKREDYKLANYHGSQYLTFRGSDFDEVVEYAKRANAMLFQITTYTAGNTLFQIPLSGSSEQIARIQNSCGLSSSSNP
jgi:hypothetical protein